MVFAASISLLLFYFLRPQDIIPALEGVNIIRPVIALGLVGLVSRQRRRNQLPPLRFMCTPHEWLMLGYLLYILLTSPDGTGILSELFAMGCFFFITMHGLQDDKLLDKYLRWWRWALLGTVLMGLGVLYGFDFTNSAEKTANMAGRLCLRHWILDNPNAYGHTLVTLLPLLYLGMFRDKSMVQKAVAVVLFLLVGACLWGTQSKGSYLVGASALVISFIVGRPLWLKIGVLAIAIGAGPAALSSMPRMSSMGSLRADEGVQGRLMAWEIARNITKNKSTGEGWRKFAAVIRWEGEDVGKATHSAYVKVGADLGVWGLMFYVSLLCCGFRTLISYPGYSKRMEQSRRILLGLLYCYTLSGWMIDRSYHTEFFLLLGAIGAYQALSVRQQKIWVAQKMQTAIAPPPSLARSGIRKRPKNPLGSGWWSRLRNWRTYGLPDIAFASFGVQMVLWTWDYILVNL